MDAPPHPEMQTTGAGPPPLPRPPPPRQRPAAAQPFLREDQRPLVEGDCVSAPFSIHSANAEGVVNAFEGSEELATRATKQGPADWSSYSVQDIQAS